MTISAPHGDEHERISTGQAVQLACLLEAAVPKVGNVHRGADFDDATFYDFVVSAVAIGQVFDQADSLSIGELVFQSVQNTQNLVATNTNLGMILLFAPLAKCKPAQINSDIRNRLSAIDDRDRDLVFEAIRLANPGGMGKVEEGDINESTASNMGLLDAMSLAKARDSIALQYSNGFQEVIEFALPTVCEAFQGGSTLADGLVLAHLKIMAAMPDTLIARKCGSEVAKESCVWAQRIVNGFQVGTSDYYSAISEFDFWLRSDGHRRNPGTSADLLAAGLFLGIQLGHISPQQIKDTLTGSRSSNY